MMPGDIGRTPECISVEEIDRYLHGALDETRLQEVRTHIKACSVCTAELALLRSFQSAEVLPEEAEPVRWITNRLGERVGEIFQTPGMEPVRRTRAPWWRISWSFSSLRTPALAFASLVIVLTVGLLRYRNSVPVLDTSAGPAVMRSQTLAVIAPVGKVDRMPSEFQWHPVAGAVRYQLRLVSVGRSELFTANVHTTSFKLSAGDSAKLTGRKTVIWEVSAVNREGAVIALSGEQQFEIVEGQ
jgi:hypothetical protein